MHKRLLFVISVLCFLITIGFNISCTSSSKTPHTHGWTNGSYLFQGQLIESILNTSFYPYADSDSFGNLTTLVPTSQWSIAVSTCSQGSSSWVLGPTISQSNGQSISSPSLVVFPSGAALACWYQENAGIMTVSRSSAGIWSSPLSLAFDAIGYRLVKGPGEFAAIIFESMDSTGTIWPLNTAIYSSRTGWSATGPLPKGPNRAMNYTIGVDSNGNMVSAWGYVTPDRVDAIFASTFTMNSNYWSSQYQLNGPPTPGAAGLFPIVSMNRLGAAMVAWNQYSIDGSPTVPYGTWYCTHTLSQGWSVAKQGPTGFTSTLLLDDAGKALSAGLTPNPFIGNANWQVQTSYFDGTSWMDLPVPLSGPHNCDAPRIAEDFNGNYYLAFTSPSIQSFGAKSVYGTHLYLGGASIGWDSATILHGQNASNSENVIITGAPGSGINIIWTNDQSVLPNMQGVSVSSWN